ncbi:neprilysin-like [Physella acuta]|uniref:neprilysin-like n=1 Tax=Physella acuta TaxID=109671 RepID=UPI0027DB76CD|nr:neprilysin-like [Physella acuta]
MLVAMDVFVFLCWMVFVFVGETTAEETGHKLEECTTKKCEYLGKRTKSFMDLTVDPCTDFYKYACGKFRPQSASSTSVIDHLNKENLKFITQKLNTSKTEGYLHFKKAKIYYQSCIKAEANDELPSFKAYLESLKTDWPTVNEQWKPTESRIAAILFDKYSANLGEPFFRITQKVDRNNKQRYLIHFDYPRETVGGREFDVVSQEQYYNLLAAKVGGISSDGAGDAVAWSGLVSTRNSLITSLGENDHQSFYKEMTLEELETKIPWMNVGLIIKRMYEAADISISPQEPIGVVDERYLEQLVQLFEMLDTRQITNAFVFHDMLERIDRLTASMNAIHNQAYQSPTPNLRFRCHEEVSRYFGESLINTYDTTYYLSTARPELAEFTKKIVFEFNRSIADKKLYAKTKEGFEKKVNNLFVYYGLPLTGRNNVNTERQRINAEYASIQMKDDDYFHNRWEARWKLMTRELKRLRKVPLRPEFPGRIPLQAEVLYSPLHNYLYISPGMLNYPMYEVRVPPVINFAALGTHIGTALAQMLDAEGRAYNERGEPIQWIHPNDQRKFEWQKICMTYKYLSMFRNFTAIQLTSSHIFEVDKIIAESLGVEHAYWAYETNMYFGDRSALPMFKDLTAPQMFFLQYAQSRCQIGGEVIENSTHTHFRVNGVLRNVQPFRQAFSCPEDSFMSPYIMCSG